MLPWLSNKNPRDNRVMQLFLFSCHLHCLLHGAYPSLMLHLLLGVEWDTLCRKIDASSIKSEQLVLLATVCGAEGSICDPVAIHLFFYFPQKLMCVLLTLEGAHSSHTQPHTVGFLLLLLRNWIQLTAVYPHILNTHWVGNDEIFKLSAIFQQCFTWVKFVLLIMCV